MVTDYYCYYFICILGVKSQKVHFLLDTKQQHSNLYLHHFREEK